ncbi:metalloregulator ArsR/SmtB family transcription factor [Modestobacter sp. KNN46-3]|uniref:ArsR/SmtB family transcription factor n=1 Tax=Modestobacter sp. KNN46-3 TaxID=2711218 RepID=UPI001F14A12E|nr:metalloregulator ArsR/SmtB family transcription factor [Modestobacter sp. KNN46-3]
MNTSRTADRPTLELVDTGAPGCSPAELAGAMSAEQAADLARTLKALADPARLRVLALVAGNEGREVCVCDLTEPLGLAQPTVSHHLKVLVDAGFLTRDKRGVWAYFALVPGALDAVVDALPGVRGRSGLS